MKYLEIPETVKISGKEAIQSLNEYINELQQQKSGELTKKQKTAMIKFAHGLIASIEHEMQHRAALKPTVKTGIMKQLRQAILKGFQEFGSESGENIKPIDAKINNETEQ